MNTEYPTEQFTPSEPKNPWINGFYVDQKRLSMDLEFELLSRVSREQPVVKKKNVMVGSERLD